MEMDTCHGGGTFLSPIFQNAGGQECPPSVIVKFFCGDEDDNHVNVLFALKEVFTSLTNSSLILDTR